MHMHMHTAANGISRRTLLAAGAVACVSARAPAQPTAYPSRPIKILVGTVAGSSTDGVARLYGQKLSELLNVPVVIDNKPGAGNLLAIRTLQGAQADGYTLYAAVGSALAQGPAVRKDLGYEPLKDFSLIAFLGTSPGSIYVAADVPIASVAELVAHAKAHPDKLSFASGGFGSAGHLQAEYFMSRTGTRMLHVPFKSDVDAAREVATGRVQVGFTTTRPIVPLAASGKVRALATTDWQRSVQLPEVPTIAQAGFTGLEGLAPYSFFGLVGPAKLPPAIVARLAESINRVSAMPEVMAQMRDTLLIEPPASGTPAEFRQLIEKETAKWREIGKSLDWKG